MAAGYREVDELNDWSASTVVPAEPAAGRRRAMVCGPCEASFVSGEVKTMGSFGPCAICGTNSSLGGPLTPEQLTEARELAAEAAGDIADALGLPTDTEPAPPPADDEELTTPIGPVAARIITPGIDDVLDAFESEEDVVNANRELLEGRPLTKDESAKWQRLFQEIMVECNKRLLAKGIILLAAAPEPNGLGGVLAGQDKASIDAASRGIAMPSEDYLVTITLPARERVDIARSEREEFARRVIDLVCSECIEQQKAYRAKAGMH